MVVQPAMCVSVNTGTLASPRGGKQVSTGLRIGLSLLCAQAFKTWVPSLPASEITVVLSSKMPAERAQVTITSYDLLVKMARELQDRKFKAVIIVSPTGIPYQAI